MATYDPKRGRPQATIAEDTAVPVDGILNDAQVVDLRRDALVPPLEVVIEPSHVEAISPPGRRVVRLIATAAGIAAALALLVAWRRSR